MAAAVAAVSAAASAREARAPAAAPALSSMSPVTPATPARTALRGVESITRLFQVWSARAFPVQVPRSIHVLPNTRLPDPYAGVQAAAYSYFEDYANFGSGPPSSLQLAPAPPDLHEFPVPSEPTWSSSTDRTLAQFVPPGKSSVPSTSVVKNITVPCSYLHSAFVVQLGSHEVMFGLSIAVRSTI